jgi:hypothetical protein
MPSIHCLPLVIDSGSGTISVIQPNPKIVPAAKCIADIVPRREFFKYRQSRSFDQVFASHAELQDSSLPE